MSRRIQKKPQNFITENPTLPEIPAAAAAMTPAAAPAMTPAAAPAMTPAAAPAMPSAQQLEAIRQRQANVSSTPAQAVVPTPGSTWLDWLAQPAILASTVQSYLSRERATDLDYLASLQTKYRAAPGVMSRVDDPILGANARKVIVAGEAAHAQARELLNSFLLYKTVYSQAGSAKSDARTLLTLTNRLLEDILLYIVLNSKKNELKTELQLKVRQPLGNSLAVQPTMFFSKEVDILPWQLRDGLNEILRANADKAKSYFLEAGLGARQSAAMPHVLKTENADNEAAYDAAMAPAVALADQIRIKRAAAYNQSNRVSPAELEARGAPPAPSNEFWAERALSPVENTMASRAVNAVSTAASYFGNAFTPAPSAPSNGTPKFNVPNITLKNSGPPIKLDDITGAASSVANTLGSSLSELASTTTSASSSAGQEVLEAIGSVGNATTSVAKRARNTVVNTVLNANAAIQAAKRARGNQLPGPLLGGRRKTKKSRKGRKASRSSRR